MNLSLFPGLARYKPNPQAIPLHQCPTRFVVVRSGTRAGKTYALAREFILRIMRDVKRYYRDRLFNRWDYLRYWVVAPTLELTEEAQDMVLSILGGPAGPMVGQWFRKNHRLYLRGIPVMVQFKSAHEPDSLVSKGINGLWIDEGARMRCEAWGGALRQRLTDRLGWALFSSSPKQRWYRDEIAEPAKLGREGWAYFEFRTVDNLAAPELVQEAQQARKEIGELYYQREYEGKDVFMQGLVFSAFNPDKNIAITYPKTGIQTVTGMDFGWENPTAVEVVRVSDVEHGKKIFVMDESVDSHVCLTGEPGDDCWKNRLNTLHLKHGFDVVYGDPSAAMMIQQLRKEKVNIRSAQIKDFLYSVEFMNRCFERQDMFIMSDCKKLVDSVTSWEWEESGDIPKRGGDDPSDAVRYALSKISLKYSTMKHERAFDYSMVPRNQLANIHEMRW